jgi:hypothetical protein
MWDYICPKCKKEVKQKSHKCVHCGENYGMPLRVPPKVLGDAKALEAYVHEHIFPKVSQLYREYLTQFFTVIFSDGFECPPNTAPSTFTAWGGVTGSPTITTSKPHSGAYNMETPEDTNNNFVQKDPLVGLTNYRLYVAVNKVQASGADGTGGPVMVASNSGIGDKLAVPFCKWNGTMTTWWLQTLQSIGGYDYVDTGVQVVANKYYCLEIWWVPNTLGGCKLYVDGVLKATTVATTTTTTFNMVLVGRFGYTEFAQKLYLDDAVAADTYIGPMASPKGTIAISAKLAGII